mgnify:CR=1 FL=1
MLQSRPELKNADRYVDASEFEDEQSMRKALLNNTVFGRVTPSQKRKFVRILKEAGHTVAMTGDGVNDVLALKDADCSIAMASGSDAAAQASQLVLLESDFSCMPEVVLEEAGCNNIQRSASFISCEEYFLIFAKRCVCRVYVYLSVGAVSSIIDQYVYNRCSCILPCSGTE